MKIKLKTPELTNFEKGNLTPTVKFVKSVFGLNEIGKFQVPEIIQVGQFAKFEPAGIINSRNSNAALSLDFSPKPRIREIRTEPTEPATGSTWAWILISSAALEGEKVLLLDSEKFRAEAAAHHPGIVAYSREEMALLLGACAYGGLGTGKGAEETRGYLQEHLREVHAWKREGAQVIDRVVDGATDTATTSTPQGEEEEEETRS